MNSDIRNPNDIHNLGGASAQKDLKSSRDALASTAETTRSKVAEHLSAAGDDVREGARQAGGEFRDLGNAAREQASRSVDAIKQEWHHAMDRGHEATARGEQLVRQNPWAAMGIAVGVGFVLAKLLSRR